MNAEISQRKKEEETHLQTIKNLEDEVKAKDQQIVN